MPASDCTRKENVNGKESRRLHQAAGARGQSESLAAYRPGLGSARPEHHGILQGVQRRPNTDKVGRITRAQVEEIAKLKMPDLTAADLNAAVRTIAGSARSMGVDVEGV